MQSLTGSHSSLRRYSLAEKGSSVPGPKCPSLTVYQAQVSQSHSEPGPICPTLTVYQAHCVPVPQCTRPNVSQTYRETGPIRSNPRIGARVRVTQWARYTTRLVHTGCTPVLVHTGCTTIRIRTGCTRRLVYTGCTMLLIHTECTT